MPHVPHRSDLPLITGFSFSILAPTLAVFSLALPGCVSTQQHEAITDPALAQAQAPNACAHGVSEDETCIKCPPQLESSAPEEAPQERDVIELVEAGEDLVSLEPYLVNGKFTVFDFHADWCPPCRYVNAFLLAKTQSRSDIAVRKLNVVSWESPLAERWLRDVPELPFLVVFGPDGTKLAELHGAKLKTLEQLLTPKIE